MNCSDLSRLAFGLFCLALPLIHGCRPKAEPPPPNWQELAVEEAMEAERRFFENSRSLLRQLDQRAALYQSRIDPYPEAWELRRLYLLTKVRENPSSLPWHKLPYVWMAPELNEQEIEAMLPRNRELAWAWQRFKSRRQEIALSINKDEEAHLRETERQHIRRFDPITEKFHQDLMALYRKIQSWRRYERQTASQQSQ